MCSIKKMSLLSDRAVTVLSTQNLSNSIVTLPRQTVIKNAVNNYTIECVCSPRVPNQPTYLIDTSTNQPVYAAPGFILSTVTLQATVPFQVANNPTTCYLQIVSYQTLQPQPPYANYGISSTIEAANTKFFSNITSAYTSASESDYFPYFAVIPDGTGAITAGTVLVSLEFARIF